MTPAELLDNPVEIRRFLNALRSQEPANSKGDSAYRAASSALFSLYEDPFQVSQKELVRALPMLIEFIHAEWGAEAAGRAVVDLARRSAPVRNLALPMNNIGVRENNYQLAVSLMKQLYDEFHSDGFVALTYAQALAGAGDFSEMDAVSEYTRHSGRTTDWEKDQWTNLMLNNLRFDEAASWISYLPEDSSLFDLASARLGSFLEGGGTLPIEASVISLHREDRKWNLSNPALLRGGIQNRRFKATDGRELPYFALTHLGNSPETVEIHGAGAIATAMSHLSVLEQFLLSGADHHLVLEDDSFPFFHSALFTETIEECSNLDLLWVNERTSLQFRSNELREIETRYPWGMLGARSSVLNGIGADGYIISRNGAEKVLQLFDDHKIASHYDAQLMSYCAASTTTNDMSRGQLAVYNTQQLLGIDPGVSLIESACLTVPMIWANSHGSSDTTNVSRQRKQGIS